MGDLIAFDGGRRDVGYDCFVGDYHVVFACLQNTGLAADLLIAAKHIKQ